MKGRFKRFRRFSLSLKEPTPEFKATDVIENYRIVGYVDYSPVRPGTTKILSKYHHWYLVQCTCENKTYVSQQHLKDTRRPRHCTLCKGTK